MVKRNKAGRQPQDYSSDSDNESSSSSKRNENLFGLGALSRRLNPKPRRASILGLRPRKTSYDVPDKRDENWLGITEEVKQKVPEIEDEYTLKKKRAR